MQPSLLEEIPQVPNPYPVVSRLEYPDVWQLCLKSRELAWDPAADVDYADLVDADLPAEVREAGAEWWSLRAWMEHGATPYGAERLRDAIFGHQPFEVKQHISNFIAEELRHHEASFRIAEALGGYQATPRADYFKAIIPKFHDERDEKAMSFFAGLSVNTLFEQLSGELLQARYENARFDSIREACRLILRDEARHIQFGRIIMRRFFSDMPADEKRVIGEKVAKKLRGSLLNGVYAVVNLPEDERARSGRNRALAAQFGLGATHPDEEMAIIRKGVERIRKDVGAYGVEIPRIAELDDVAH
ncbi:MAG TPA: hypothetical protein VN789_06375 [Casimicrobiaceae bacterium]|jgi:hypothetical protein|nr:hypothetical protein [Casimicrobiaceae bacterium]